jgi:hypothetical protein
MRKQFLFLLLDCLVFLLNACSSQCVSGEETQPANFITGQQQGIATIGTFCTDKRQYDKGDTVHITLTVKNGLDKQIVLGGGQQPVMDICDWRTKQCLSQAQPAVAGLTRLVLEPGQSHTIQWNWPTPEVDVKGSLDQVNEVAITGYWVGKDGLQGELNLFFTYGEKIGRP